MKNYVISYHFSDSQTQNQFEQKLKKLFPQHQLEQHHGLPFMVFQGRKEPGVEASVKDLLGGMRWDRKDYVALYFDDPHQPERRIRVMVIGHDSDIDAHIDGQFKTSEFNRLMDEKLSLVLQH